MKTKPWTIFVLALIHILAPLGNIFANSIRAGRSITEQVNYWFNVLPTHLLLIYLFIPIAAGIFIFICRRWSYWGYLICLGVLFASNIYAFTTNTSLTNFLFLCGALLIDLLVVAYFVVPSVRQVYFDPKIRWWETALRYTYSPEVVVNGSIPGKINNISEGGLFIQTEHTFHEGDKVSIRWTDSGDNFETPGHVVYVNSRAHGSGVQFEHTDESQVAMKKLTKRLHKQGLVIPDRLPGPQDSFGVWLKKLFQTGDGLFPKI